PRREHGREVEHVHAERYEMVEPLLDATEVAAEPLHGRVGAAPGRELIPVPRDRPGRRRDGAAGRRETIGKDLVDGGLEVPVGPARSWWHDEVVRVGDVRRAHAER